MRNLFSSSLASAALLIASSVVSNGQLVTNIVNVNISATTNRIVDAVSLTQSTTNFFTFTVAGLNTNIVDLDFRLSVLHSAVGDLDVFLVSPSGVQMSLTNLPVLSQGGTGNNFQDTYFDEQGGVGRIGTPGLDTAPFAGPEYGGVRYKTQLPLDTLNKFTGINPNGVWTVIVEDLAPGDDGFLLWSGANPSVLDDSIMDSGPQIGSSWGTNAIGTQLIITTAVPEPSVAALAGIGLAGLVMIARRHRRS